MPAGPIVKILRMGWPIAVADMGARPRGLTLDRTYDCRTGIDNARIFFGPYA